MTALHVPAENIPFHIDMLRDDVRVIERRTGDLKALKAGFSKLHRILDKMPLSKGDTAADLAATRDSRGKA